MFAKASTILAVFAVAARVVVAAPPACLLAAVNTCPDPADIEAICSESSSKVTSYLSENCGEHEDAAIKYFKEVCEDAGETISSSSSSSSSTATSHSGTKTASASGTLSSATGTGNSHSNSTDLSSTITGASTFATGISGAASGTGSNGIYATNSNNGTVLSTAGTAGPTTTGNAGTNPTGAAVSGSVSEGSAARMGMEVAGLAMIGVVGAMFAL